MSTDNHDQPIEVTNGTFAIQANQTTPTAPTDSEANQAPATGVGASVHPALVLTALTLTIFGAGIAAYKLRRA